MGQRAMGHPLEVQGMEAGLGQDASGRAGM